MSVEKRHSTRTRCRRREDVAMVVDIVAETVATMVVEGPAVVVASEVCSVEAAVGAASASSVASTAELCIGTPRRRQTSGRDCVSIRRQSTSSTHTPNRFATSAVAQRSCCGCGAARCRLGSGTRCARCPLRKTSNGLLCCSRYPPTASRARRTCARTQAESRLTLRTSSRGNTIEHHSYNPHPVGISYVAYCMDCTPYRVTQSSTRAPRPARPRQRPP